MTARLLLLLVCAVPALAQPTRAVLVDGPGPWRDDRWVFTVAQFSSILSDAGYPVTTVAPGDIASVLGSPGILLAVPSLESIPATSAIAIYNFINSGGSLMASGGEPWRDPLYLAPDGSWLDAAAYQQAVGSPPSTVTFVPPRIATISPWYEQFTTSAGLRFPIVQPRGIGSGQGDYGGRYRTIGDLITPAATIYSYAPFGNFSNGTLYPGLRLVYTIWLPSPQIGGALRAELVDALRQAQSGLALINAGPVQIVWLPGETITGAAVIANATAADVPVTLEWSITGSSGVVAQPAFSFPATNGVQTAESFSVTLPVGDYTLNFHLLVGGQEVDRIDSPVRVLDPILSRQPDQKIRVLNGAFYAGGKRVYLHGVNYWPRNNAVLIGYNSWFQPEGYDPEVVEADLSLIESLGFNLVNIQYVDLQLNWAQQARSLMDFLDRCRNHGIWARIDLPATTEDNAFGGSLNPKLGAFLQAANLPGNDRVFSYELLWEPYIGSQNQGGYGAYIGTNYVYNVGRTVLDPDWRAWVNDQYGSLANAQQTWGLTAPVDANGQLTSPTDDQIANDGAWRIMVAAYRRFLDDDLGRNLGVIAREIRRTDPDTLLSYRNWSTMTGGGNSNTGYDLGTGAAHLDYFSPESYDPAGWPARRDWGFATAYSRYRTGGKPVQWAEFGADIGIEYGTPVSRAAQGTLCDAVMRQVADDGSDADSIWFWPGGLNPADNLDFGIIDPDGTPRDCAVSLQQWGATFAQTPPDMGPGLPAMLMVDRDADARGQFGMFLNYAGNYVSARAAGQPVVLVDAGTGSDTSSMPLVQVGNAAYSGAGPLKFANAESGGVRIVCPNLDVTVENNSQVQIPSGASCQMTPTMVNTGEGQWLGAGASKGGVVLHTSLGDVPLAAAVPALSRAAMGPLAFTMGASTVNFTGRMRVQPSNDFGEVLRLTLATDATGTGSCATALSASGPISAPAAGVSANVAVTAPAACAWTAASPQPWVAVTPASGMGNGPVGYVVQPNSGPARQTTITIAGHPFTVTQAAAANPSQVPPPSLSTTSLNFGSQTVGAASAGASLVVTNSGSSALNFATFSIGGADAGDFTQSNTCGSALAAGASCKVTANFTPASVGPRAASLYISGNLSGGPVAIQLTGTGLGTGPMPAIQAIVDAWNYTPGIAPGLWVTIAGTNLAAFAQTANFSAVEQLPTSLGGVSVTFNGVPAALLYVSPQQVDALVPASIAAGPVQVVVDANGVLSNSFAITAKATQPAVYALPNSDASSFFVTAALQGTGFLVGNVATDPRALRPVFPGDVLDLYMIGLGATADPSKFITNREFSGAFAVAAPVTVTVGGESAAVLFAGLTAPGLYLARVTIPADLKPGPQPIQVVAGALASGGAQSRAGLTLTMGAAGANLVQNGSFESALAGSWSLTVNSSQGAAATVQTTTSTSEDGRSSAQITVTAASNPPDVRAVQLSQTGIALQPGQVYRLQFWAKSDTARTVGFDIGATATGSVALSGDWQQYTVYFQAAAADAAARIDFYFGDQTGNTWLDAVSLVGPSQ